MNPLKLRFGHGILSQRGLAKLQFSFFRFELLILFLELDLTENRLLLAKLQTSAHRLRTGTKHGASSQGTGLPHPGTHLALRRSHAHELLCLSTFCVFNLYFNRVTNLHLLKFIQPSLQPINLNSKYIYILFLENDNSTTLYICSKQHHLNAIRSVPPKTEQLHIQQCLPSRTSPEHTAEESDAIRNRTHRLWLGTRVDL